MVWIPTIKIKAKTPCGYVKINTIDYDPSIHEHFKEDGDEFQRASIEVTSETAELIKKQSAEVDKDENPSTEGDTGSGDVNLDMPDLPASFSVTSEPKIIKPRTKKRRRKKNENI